LEEHGSLFGEVLEIPHEQKEKHVRKVNKVKAQPVFHHSNGATGSITRSETHGGFDNDPFTMNHVLSTVLDRKPNEPFTAEELSQF